MLITYDIENYRINEKGLYEPILDATGDYFVVGCIKKETGGSKTFTNKEDMWKYIIELGRKEVNKGKRLICYAHNARYDFYQIADLNDRSLRWFSEDPFIAGYYFNVKKKFKSIESMENWKGFAKRQNINYRTNGALEVEYNKEGIKFLDTMSIFRMSLKKVGDIIGVPKLELPIEIGERMTKGKLKIISKYCINDCKVTLEAVKYLKKKLKDEGIKIKNLCTINQIAISYVLKRLRELDCEHILRKNDEGKLTEYTYKSKYKDEIHSAYRGGFVRLWRTGFLENITAIDFNSLYPYSAINIRFPDLRTERKMYEPLRVYSPEELFSKIGLSRVMIKNVSDKLGLLPIRVPAKNYVPRNGKVLIGTWTHMELEEALRNGYELVSVQWSIIWDEGMNPFKKIFGDLYEKKKSASNDFDYYFYKMMMNGSLGKFGQTRTSQEFLIDSCEKIYEYLKKGFIILKGIEGKTDVMYLNKDVENKRMKKYYAPIIPTLVNAYSRILMYRFYKKVPLDKLIYTDTDNIITIGDYSGMYDIGNEIGQFKVEKDCETGEDLRNVKAVIWGTKSKSVGNNIALSGVFKSGLDLDSFKKGKVEYKKMVGIKNNVKKRAGEFVIEERDLKKQEKQYWESEKLLDEEKLFIDDDIQSIVHFAKDIQLNVAHESSKV